MAKKLPIKKKSSKKKFVGFMLPISLTLAIRKLASDRNRQEKKAGSRLTTNSDIVEAALCDYL
jgi:hypothetical protein